MLLSEIKLNKKIRNLNEDTVFKFNDKVTYVVGQNGSGKSTLSDLIVLSLSGKYSFNNVSNDIKEEDYQVTKKDELKEENYILLDSVEGLLKTQSYFDDDMDLHLKTMGVSSGEGLLFQLEDLNNKEFNNKILILDEPERGLSIKQQFTLDKYIKFLADKTENTQVIVITHSYPIISMAKEVFSMDEMKFEKGTEFIDKQYL